MSPKFSIQNFDPYVESSHHYMERVASGDIPLGKLTRNFVLRIIKDLQRQDTAGFPYVFDEERARDAVDRIQRFKIPLGSRQGDSFILLSYQRFVVEQFYGWVNLQGYRRFKKVYIEGGRGSGKTLLGAAICNDLMFHEGNNFPGDEGYCAASSGKQASNLFGMAWMLAHQMDGVTPTGRSRKTSERIYSTGLETTFDKLAYSHDGDGVAGANALVNVADELHEMNNDAMVEAMEYTSRAHDEYLMLQLTNTGFVSSFCYDIHREGNLINDPDRPDVIEETFLPFILALDEGDYDPKEGITDERNYLKTNPLLPVMPVYENLLSKARGAMRNVEKRADFERNYLNIWQTSRRPSEDYLGRNLILQHQVDALPFSEEELRSCPVTSAVDLALTNDLISHCVLHDVSDLYGVEKYYPIFFTWSPEETLRERAEKDSAPYLDWVADGFLTPTPGRIFSFEYVYDSISDMYMRYPNCGILAYDNWKFKDVERMMEENRFDYVRYGEHVDDDPRLVICSHSQGIQAPPDQKEEDAVSEADKRRHNRIYMLESLEEAKRLVEEGKMIFTPNPIFLSAVTGIRVYYDGKRNMGLAKSDMKVKIDAGIAFVMACGAMMKGKRKATVVTDGNKIIPKIDFSKIKGW